jgi:sortase A
MKLSRPSAKTIRKTLTGLALVLALGGAALIAYPFATDMWAGRIQTTLRADLALNTSADTYRAGEVKVGKALTRLQIPSLDLDTIVVEGTTPAALRAGAGHYPKTPLPGEAGNVAIAGHRTTYGRPFNRMDDLKPGDKVILTTPIGKHTYEVITQPFVVSPNDWTPISEYPEGGSFLTLTSCHPEGSAAYRIVVRAELVESTDIFAQAVQP